MDDSLDSVLVVVPVRDEAELLGSCLAHLQVAVDALQRARPHFHVHLRVVLDGCRDSSGSIATSIAGADPRITVVRVDFGSVGASRRAGIDGTLDSLAAGAHDAPLLHHTWIACTDADTRVPAHWLTGAIALAEGGYDAIAGTVEPDRVELGEALFAAWTREHRRHEGHLHVHGANLGVRASAYRAAGGFDPVQMHEDVLLVEKLRSSGARILATGQLHAVTSGRVQGRVDTGFSGYLRELTRGPATGAGGLNL